MAVHRDVFINRAGKGKNCEFLRFASKKCSLRFLHVKASLIFPNRRRTFGFLFPLNRAAFA